MAKRVDTVPPAPAQAASAPPRPVGGQPRPTGAPPPLPRKIGRSGVLWLVLAAAVLASEVLGLHYDPWLRLVDHADTAILRAMAAARVGWLDTMARGIKAAGSGWALTVVWLG